MRTLIGIIVAAVLFCHQSDAAEFIPLRHDGIQKYITKNAPVLAPQYQPKIRLAQSLLLLGAGGSSSAAYIGPGDLGIPNIVAFASTARCYSTSYTGLVADITDSATGSTTGTRLQCSSGGVISAVVSASACTFVTGNACSTLAITCLVACNVRTAYDQSGLTNCATSSAACNIAQATNANRPAYTASAIGGRSCMTFAGGSQTLLSAGTVTGPYAQPYTLMSYAERTGSFTSAMDVAAVGIVQLFFGTSANEANIFAGTVSANVTATDLTPHSLIGVYNGSSSSLQVDGTLTPSLTAGANVGSGGDFAIGLNHAITGIVCELAAYSTGMSTGNQTLLASNQATFY